MKSDIQIKDDIYDLLKTSSLASSITGKICKRSKRPKGSEKEDVVISVIANMNGQMQEATVNVNIYVKDDFSSDGQNEEPTIRLRTLCNLAKEVLEVGRGDGFRFTLESQHVLAVDDDAVHVINNRLNYKQVNE